MSYVNYLCIDDQPEETIRPLLTPLEQADGKLNFLRMHPTEIGQQIAKIIELTKSSECFGLLLDLRLDMDADQEGNRVIYRGPTLAQELRTRMAEGGEKNLTSFPIILWSVNQKFSQSYFNDDTSHDLFDLVVNKDDIVSSQRLALETISLARGYKTLSAYIKNVSKHSDKILGLEKEELITLDPRLLEAIQTSSISDLALTILKKIIKREGVLVDEETLAARLGVNSEESGTEWDAVLNALTDSKYKGVFHDGWNRWWWHKVENWWSTLHSRKGTIRRIGSRERANVINLNLGTNLIAAEPISSEYSDKFYTLCKATKCPIDTIDGIKILCNDLSPWEDPPYVSIDAALKRINRDLWKPDPLEKSRLEELKKLRK